MWTDQGGEINFDDYDEVEEPQAPPAGETVAFSALNG